MLSLHITPTAAYFCLWDLDTAWGEKRSRCMLVFLIQQEVSPISSCSSIDGYDTQLTAVLWPLSEVAPIADNSKTNPSIHPSIPVYHLKGHGGLEQVPELGERSGTLWTSCHLFTGLFFFLSFHTPTNKILHSITNPTRRKISSLGPWH